MRTEPWDWPPTRGWRHQRTVYRLTLNTDRRRTHWDSPITKKIVDIYWQTVVVVIKMLLAAALTIALIASIWFLWVVIGLVV
jgi:hypothetical protein